MINKNPLNKLITKIDDSMVKHEKEAQDAGYAVTYSLHKNFVHELDEIKKKLKEIEKTVYKS
jgi:hypothetical protein